MLPVGERHRGELREARAGILFKARALCCRCVRYGGFLESEKKRNAYIDLVGSGIY